VKLKEIMRVPPVVISEGTTVSHAALMMEQSGCGFLPVVRNGMLVGVITARDFATRLATRALNLQAIPVWTVMTSPAIALEAESDTEEAVILMRKHDVHRVVVTDALGAVAGVVSLADLAGNVADDSIVQALLRHAKNTPPPENPFGLPIRGLFMG